uniref:Ig-like domain-containing protein n=1 Tax=Electrophorus electricus TaxID=8005 RepID=A0AAY5EKG1_ELEEL
YSYVSSFMFIVLISLVQAGLAQGHVKAVVSVSPDNQLFRGETVTLRCDIQGEGDTGWTYSWYKNNYSLYPHTTYNPYMISSVTQYYSGTYTCSGYRGRDSQSSEISNAVTLTVAQAVLSPQSPVFTGESVTLKCEVQGYDGQWTTVAQSVFDTVHRDTLTIIGDAVVNGDQYQCRGERHDRPTTSQYSNTVTLTVHVKPTPELISSLKGAALVGNPVTLHCKLDQSAEWSFYWSRHTQKPENESNTAANSYNISSVAPSDGGQYWCRAGRGNPVYYTNYNDALWVNLTGEEHSFDDSSSLGLVGLTVGPSLVVFFLLLILLWCYKTNKGLRSTAGHL